MLHALLFNNFLSCLQKEAAAREFQQLLHFDVRSFAKAAATIYFFLIVKLRVPGRSRSLFNIKCIFNLSSSWLSCFASFSSVALANKMKHEHEL